MLQVNVWDIWGRMVGTSINVLPQDHRYQFLQECFLRSRLGFLAEVASKHLQNVMAKAKELLRIKSVLCPVEGRDLT